MKNLLIGLLFAFLLVGLAATANASLLENSNFDESGVSVPNRNWDVYDQIYGWKTESGPGIEIEKNKIINAHSGDYYVELDSHKNSSMFQEVDLEMGTYELSFWYHARTNTFNDNGIHAFIDDVQIGMVSKKNEDMDSLWELITWEFTVENNDTYKLIFGAYGLDNSLGGFIDTVSLDSMANPIPNPEPATMLLFGMGLLGVSGIIRRKKI